METTRRSAGRLGRARAGLVLTLLAASAAAAPASLLGQQASDSGAIAFDGDLPRTLVFISERGTSQVATREMTNFLRKAGFPLVDPALAHTAAQRTLVQQALSGDEGAATELGRDFGAQLLVIGRATWGTRPDPVDGTLVTATSQVSVRALRLDKGHVVASADADGRGIDATDQAARDKVIGQATDKLLQGSPFVGQVMNDWSANPWDEQAYWVPDPGSVPAEVDKARTASAPALAILRADVQPSSGAGKARGLGVVRRGSRTESLYNPVRLEGVVVGKARDVKVQGHEANVEDLPADEAKRLGVDAASAHRFWSEFNLPMSEDSVIIQATGEGGAVTKTVASPRIRQRWAVVIGISKYKSDDIPNLGYARSDAQEMYDFLTSSEAGPFPKDHVLFLTDEKATGAAMRKALFVFLQQAHWDDLVVIYYAGHGAPDPNRPDNLYLIPYDADLNSLASTAFPMWDVKTALRRQIRADRVVVIADACHSAGTTQSAIPGVKDNPIAGGFSHLFTPSRRLTLTAADTNEFSLEDAQWGGGVFTHYLVKALQGSGDENGDGIVTFQEAYDYVHNQVVQATQGRQHPQRTGFGDVPLSVVPTATGDQ